MALKVARLICYLLFRILLPVTLLAASVLRYNGLSFVYAVCLLLAPLIQSPTEFTIRGRTGRYLKALIGISVIGILAHAIFHITLVSIQTDDKPYGSLFPNCSTYEQLARQLGLERLDNVPVGYIIRLVLPEVVVFAVSLLVLLISLKLLKPDLPQDNSGLNVTNSLTKKKRVASLLAFIGEFIVALLLAASGIIVPTVIASIYFLSFIYIATWWAFYESLGRKFRYFRIFLLIYCAVHILVLYLYQFQFFQEILPPDDFIARLIGLTGIIHTDCSRPYSLIIHDDITWPLYVNPGILLLLYWVLAFQTRCWCQEKGSVDGDMTVEETKKKHKHYKKPTERQCLVGEEHGQNYSSMGEVNQADDIPTPTMSGDDSDIDEAEEKQRNKHSNKHSPLMSMFLYIMKQSYVLALFAMMAWSITFHSWLTFVLLLWACIIWMVPKSRQACLFSSPIIVIYAEILLGIQYVYGMNLKELPNDIGEANMKEIGFQKFTYPCLQLALQILFTSMFWLTLRLFSHERYLKKNPGSLSDFQLEDISSRKLEPQSLTEFFKTYLLLWLSKYWIFVCAIMLMVISLQEVVIYRIVYMFLFLFFILAFQLSYGFWRLTMLLFWWVVIIYSMAVLIMLYTYQFSKFPEYWRTSTGLSNQTLSDIGLEQFDMAGLFIKLLTPTSFVIVIIIQVHYFHTPFLRLSAVDRHRREETEPKLINDDISPVETESITSSTDGELRKKEKTPKSSFHGKVKELWIKTSELWNKFSNFLWRLSEIHVFKAVALTILVVSTVEVSAIGAVYVLLLVIFLPMTHCHICMSHIAQIWTALILLAKMIYQLRLVETNYWLSNCTTVNENLPSPPFNETIDNAVWAGLEKTSDIAYYVKNYIAVLVIIVLESIIRYRQRQYYNQLDIKRPKTGVIFPKITKKDADRGIRTCLMFLGNFFFCKFGLEVCYIVTAITICVRIDAVAVLYAIFLGILLLLSRRNNARIWPLYVLVLAILLPLQYFSALGFPLGLCIEYPWDSAHGMNRNLEHWLYLSDYIYGPESNKLLADFFQILFVCLQWRVFRMETGSKKGDLEWGDNEDILCEVEANAEIPVNDYTSEKDSYLDIIKHFVFMYMFWITLAIIFIAGTTQINLFSMGYVIAVFCFMWYGQEFLIKPLRKLRRMWGFLIGYCFLVILVKAVLQLLGCVYIDYLYDNQCWVIQLLGVNCREPSQQYAPGSETGSCEVEEDNTGLTWDVVCFAFLLLQQRLYNSHYFRHIVASLKSQNKLASRGAELINRVLVQEVQKQKQDETIILENIKKKMNYLKERQKKKQKKDIDEIEEHFQAIRSGDYYLFEEDSETEKLDDPKHPDTLTLGTDKDADKDKKPTPLQLINTAIDAGAAAAIKHSQSDDSMDDDQNKDEPGVHRGGDTVEEEQKSEEEEEAGSKASNFLRLIARLVASFIDWIIDLFDGISANYRLVASKLEEEMKEKIRLKHRGSLTTAEEEQRLVSEEERVAIEGSSREEDDVARGPTSSDLIEVAIVPIDRKHPNMDSLAVDGEKTDQEVKFEQGQPRLYRLLVATLYMLIARSELVCYFLMIWNQILSASLLSLPLPLMVFLWGMLSVPRPTKTFWITAITYTEAMIVVKYLFQFSFFPWNTSGFHEEPFWPPRILGIEKRDNYATADLILLLALFIHRSILKRYGLWRDEEGITADLEKAEEKEQRKSQSEHDASQPSLESGTASQNLAIKEAGQQEEEEEGEKSKFNVGQLLQPFRNFYRQLTNPEYCATADEYAPMFACDLINFLIIVFGYWAFGPAESAGGGDVSSYLSENRVPVQFLIMLVAQFVLIIIDRALYLRKNILGKFFFQIILVSVIHIWMFFILPYTSTRSFVDNLPAQLFYFIKCVYFGLSAYQIRAGYPTRILGNFLTKKYNHLNLFLFQGFLAIPFLLELRSLMDWMWTDTTLSIGSWLQMEDIYNNIYVLKCWRHAEANFPTQRGNKKKAVIKYGVGGLLLFIIIFIIWFPLVIFSIANTVFVPNPPVECTVSIAVGGYEPLLKMTTQTQGIKKLESAEFDRFKSFYVKDMKAVGFLSTYEADDLTYVKLNGQSSSVWGISPPSEKTLASALYNSTDMKMEFSVSFSRGLVAEGNAETLSNLFVMDMTKETREKMAKIIESNQTETNVSIMGLFPRFLRLGGQGKADQIDQLLNGVGMSNLSLTLNHQHDSETSWWQAMEIVHGTVLYPNFDNSNLEDTIAILTFNDRVAPAGFSIITGYGIIGLYITFILLIGRILRMSTTGLLDGISFKELPFVDNILQLCLDLYMVREMMEFRLEEDLYAKLIFVYRSAETRIKWTRLPPDLLITKKIN